MQITHSACCALNFLALFCLLAGLDASAQTTSHELTIPNDVSIKYVRILRKIVLERIDRINCVIVFKHRTSFSPVEILICLLLKTSGRW